ncbi:hypothetical protein GBA63_22145 (plasmid) [Rubrobacter tropicus]|uniref:ParB/Sulfiredoxin domain-containing protein n=1 Tax=Rubrobacter tropicus TaxID=2653851 RepID=A0A6G8QG26_9ACTN|nr:hypothetical protein [Rubrobacter tropicus]QIN85408.1 hypothetical protein GBA63_22145 [Rubrobacter tropicus]
MYSAELQEKSMKDFARARRTASTRRLLGRLAARLRGVALCCASPACFEAAREGSGALPRGRERVETVEVARIRGTVGRCRDFDRDFLPLSSALAKRWVSVDRAFHEGRTLPPVELYELGGDYFVVDGNHRVSVARVHGAAAVDAVVKRYAKAHAAACGC